MAAQRRQQNIMSRISDDITETIISFLPAKDIATLSLISRRFRNSWKLCRDLSFNRSVARNLSREEYINLVNRYLHDHLQTRADKLSLFFDHQGETQLVCHWIVKAVQLGISELELDFTSSPPMSFILHSHLFNVGNIRTLNILNCGLDIPISSNHLQNLKDLKIQETETHPMMLESVFKNCFVLRTLELIKCKSIFTLVAMAEHLKYFKTLVIKNCFDIWRIQIALPTLGSLHYHGKICELNFHSNFPFLDDVILNIAPPRGFQLFRHKQDMAITLKYVTTLTVTNTFHEGLSARFAGDQFKEVEFYLANLKEFHLIVMGGSNLTPFDIALFLRRCPRIERVFIDLKLNSFGDSIYWNFHGRNDLSQLSALYPHLQYVKIKGFTFRELPVTMARLFLRLGRFLQTLVIVKARNYNSSEVLIPERIRSEIPTNTQIQIYEYRQDRSVLIPKHFKHIN